MNNKKKNTANRLRNALKKNEAVEAFGGREEIVEEVKQPALLQETQDDADEENGLVSKAGGKARLAELIDDDSDEDHNERQLLLKESSVSQIELGIDGLD